MKKYTAVLMSILLLTFVYSINSEGVFASTPMQEKKDILEDLEQIKNDSEINKKAKKSLEKAIKEIKKSLDPQLWKDESTLNFKDGKKVFDAEEKAVKKLEQIINDKKESEQIKNNIIEILEKLVNIDKALVEIVINDAIDSVADEKSIKKLGKAQKIFEKGNSELDNENFQKAVKHFGDAWNKTQKALKEPHAKKMKLVNEIIVTTLEQNDDLNDIFIKIENPGKSNKPIKVDIKIRDNCVNGITHDDATMKIAFSEEIFLPAFLTDEVFEITNKWFKKNDDNKQIDPFTDFTTFFEIPETGDDMIQKNPGDKKGSFEYNSVGISEIDGQTGWEGSFEFKGNPGEYQMNFWLQEIFPQSQGDDCNLVPVISIGTIIIGP